MAALPFFATPENGGKPRFSTRQLTLMAILIAMQIVLARVTSISVGQWLRISFGFLPTAVCGLLMGPVAAMIVAGLADVLGTAMTGQAILIGLTITTMFDGFMYGLILHKKPVKLWRCALAMLPMALITSMLLNTFILADAGFLASSAGAEWPQALQGFAAWWTGMGRALPNFVSFTNRIIKAAVQYPVNVAMLYALGRVVERIPASITRV